jgi:hypothetical protein
MGNPPNFASLGNGSAMSVVSRSEGRGSKAGALVELYWPSYATDNLWDSYVGVRSRGKKLRWAHQLELTGQRVVDDTGLVQSDFDGGDLTMRVEDVMRPSSDAHVRHVVVTNKTAAPIDDAEVAFYAFFTIDNLPTGDRIRFDAPSGALVQSEGATAIATLADRPPVASHCGQVLSPLGRQRDARAAAESGKLSPCTSAAAGLTGVNGVLVHSLGTIPAHETRDITYAIGLGADEAHALAAGRAAFDGGFAARVSEDRDRWAGVLARATIPPRLPPDAIAVYRRAIVTMFQHRVSNGAFVAASTLTSPAYRFVWPRDGSKTAVDLLEAGFVDEAKAFFEFLETLPHDDGSFAINYIPDGKHAFLDWGADLNENDEPAMLPWGVDRVYEVTHDASWLRARWSVVRRIAEHIVALGSTTSGLVKPSRDLWELDIGGSWTYTNGANVAGLEAASRIATALGAAADADRYASHAKALRAAMEANLVTPDGYWARGMKYGLLGGSSLDSRLEIANLAFGRGGFDLYPDTDPRLALVGDRVKQRLAMPDGAVRRYEGDRYYGGQPWPVAAAWLAQHELARGDRASAEKRFATLTRQARATDSRMLGEQFDEDKKEWVSAMPLVWSEAAYVRSALVLYR